MKATGINTSGNSNHQQTWMRNMKKTLATVLVTGTVTVSALGIGTLSIMGANSDSAAPQTYDTIGSERELGRYAEPTKAGTKASVSVGSLIPQPYDTFESERELNRKEPAFSAANWIPQPYDTLESEMELNRAAEIDFAALVNGIVPQPYDTAESERELNRKEPASGTVNWIPQPYDTMESELELNRTAEIDFAALVNGIVPQPWDTTESEIELGMR